MEQLLLSLGYVTEDKTAEILDVTEGTLVSWRKQGRGPEYALAGNRYFYPIDSIKKYIDSNRRTFSKPSMAKLL